MSTYPNDTKQAVTDAVSWASESAQRNLSTYVKMVDSSLDQSYTADELAADMATLSIGLQQDAARMFTTWSKLLTGLAK